MQARSSSLLGVNLKSESNTANVTVYEEDLDAKQLEGVEGAS